MRHMDRYPFFIAIILFLLAWILGLPMRAQSAPLKDIHCILVEDSGSGVTLYQEGVCDQRASPASILPKGLTRAAFLKDLPGLIK
ncbi:hypothetical protein EOA60_07220 [Mesorhizobium sp. M1A.F.Ca.IN.020.06.1.1]|nr:MULTISPECIES: hypothetical protein [unclassified Mesorhizobium]RUV01294.1 hypothetical protein EOA79_19190 [Mesorhizobium sp. M1A.F.Ca.IN.020.03.2.1]RUV83163.1 hypothetical protein EOA51_26140 [Mesorhizobium sp. M1A.F.Ca.IN.020.32.1.1]RUW13013.1 hypothetical protein EOA46_07630 [Mesorhizobium sp. M1A.F.Ca.IN.022.05.2.1]RUW33714.1 hypothetical protein EOA60_07220 [Mesorhizobium sp. M1A.F.Ca.IN.020.06.1.1]RWF84793.1 MAG: hypothetical protein EOQ35_01195 [Mesorhizobium sp.]